jgi:tetratricopeptide (TPR) repeat protein
MNEKILSNAGKAEKYYYAGEECAKSGRYEEAILWYDKALALKADAYNFDCWYSEGLCFLKLGKTGAAFNCFKMAERDKSNGGLNECCAESAMAFGLEDIGKYDEAVEYYDKGIEKYGGIEMYYSCGCMHYIKAQCLIKAGRLAEAADCFGEVIKMDGCKLEESILEKEICIDAIKQGKNTITQGDIFFALVAKNGMTSPENPYGIIVKQSDYYPLENPQEIEIDVRLTEKEYTVITSFPICFRKESSGVGHDAYLYRDQLYIISYSLSDRFWITENYRLQIGRESVGGRIKKAWSDKGTKTGLIKEIKSIIEWKKKLIKNNKI